MRCKIIEYTPVIHFVNMKNKDFFSLIEKNIDKLPLFYQTAEAQTIKPGRSDGVELLQSEKYGGPLILFNEYVKPISKIIPYSEFDDLTVEQN